MNISSASKTEAILGTFILVFVFYACSLERGGARRSAGAGAQPEWKTYCDRELRFLIRYPPEMELRVKPPELAAEGKFNLLEWETPRSEWSVVLHIYELPGERRTEPLGEWLEGWGGSLEEITLDGDRPAVLRTSLFEAVFEKSVFFRAESGDRVVEIRLVVPKIADWTGQTEKVAPQYREQESIFDRMVKSIRGGACS